MAQTGARARARAERERLAAAAAERRAAEAAKREVRHARIDRLTGWIPRRGPRPTGALAERRARNVRILVAVLVVVDVLVYLLTRDVGVTVFAVIGSVMVSPVLYTLLFRR